MVFSRIFNSFTTSSGEVFGERRYVLYSEYGFYVCGFKYGMDFFSFLTVCQEEKSCVITLFVELPLSLNNGIRP